MTRTTSQMEFVICADCRCTVNKDKAKAVKPVGGLPILVCPECFAFRRGNRR